MHCAVLKFWHANRLLTLLWLALGFSLGCASEKSSQDKKREEEERTVKRLIRAEGSYAGYASQAKQERIPIQLTIKLLQNPGDQGDQPLLQVSFTIGLFGGVKLTSTSTTFDWKTGELNANFKSAGNGNEDNKASAVGAGVELQAKLKDNGEISRATIKGPSAGDFALSLAKLKTGLADEGNLFYYYFTTSPDKERFLSNPAEQGIGVMSLKRLENAIVTSPTSDLPRLPGLEASFRFFGLADAPETARSVEYDPLTGILEATLISGARVTFTKLFAKEGDGFTLVSPEVLDGRVFFGSNPRMPFMMAAISGDFDLSDISYVPPKSYVGTYESVDNNIVWNMIAHIDYLGGADSNTVGETAFSVFPKLRIRTITCLGARPYQSRILDLNFVDHVRLFARFQKATPSGVVLLELTFGKHWQHLEGTFVNRGEGSDRPRSSNVKLDALPEELREGCEYFGG